MDAAARECREEAGLEPARLEPLYSYAANPGRSAWAVHLFFCRVTAAASADLSDPTEQVRTVRMTVDELDDLIRRNEIVDPSLLIARSLAGMRGLLPPLA
ncbi:8-oxo-dGTP pyrophosphatase MutT (NUDIX family) [Glaciihabitans sp. UYNi722]